MEKDLKLNLILVGEFLLFLALLCNLFISQQQTTLIFFSVGYIILSVNISIFLVLLFFKSRFGIGLRKNRLGILALSAASFLLAVPLLVILLHLIYFIFSALLIMLIGQTSFLGFGEWITKFWLIIITILFVILFVKIRKTINLASEEISNAMSLYSLITLLTFISLPVILIVLLLILLFTVPGIGGLGPSLMP